MLSYIISALYYLIPAAALAVFVVSLISFLSAKKKNKQTPGTYSDDQMITKRICLIVSSVILGILAVVVIGFIVLMMVAVTFM